MAINKMANNSVHVFPIPGELITDYRTRFALEQSHADERRRTELAELTSAENDPERRIGVWEKLHALKLPLETVHPLLSIIARDTGLTLAQVQNEQQKRSTAVTDNKDDAARPTGWDPYCTRPANQR